jgi:hypothetical protein
VLELPQIINPQVYAARAKAGIAEGTRLGNDYYPADQPADDSLTAAGDPSATAVAPWDPGDLAGNPSNDDQDYADQDDGGGTSGPVVVYAVPVYAPQPVYVPQFVPPVAVTANPLPQPYPAATIPRGQLPMYSALAYRPLPMYSGLRPVSPGRYATAGGGSRLMGSHFGQRFGIGSFSRGR